MSRVLLTGGTGFTGRRFIEEILQNTDWEIVSLERISKRQSQSRLGLKVVYHDFRARLPVHLLDSLQDVSHIVHCGAEVHGLRSLLNPTLFVQQNILGTFNMLEAARRLPNLKCFQYISSAEAVGSAREGYLDENAQLHPSNPYAAAKGGGEMLCNAYRKSFGVPAQIIRTMNIYGEGQGTDKFLPAVIKKILTGETVNIHVGADGRPGSRQWIYVGELVRAMRFLLEHGRMETYHVVGPEKTNHEIVFSADRALRIPVRAQTSVAGPSHDIRYALSDTKTGALGFAYMDDFNETFAQTVKWFASHREALR